MIGNMKNINNLKKLPYAPVAAFSVAVLFLTTLYWAVMLFTKSAWIDSYFLADHKNTGMDYFNMLANSAVKDPYAANSNYPAMCFFFLKIMRHFIPNCDAADFQDGFDYRGNMVAQLGYFLFVITCILILVIAVKIIIKGNDLVNTLLITSLIISGPMIFLLERGNILLAVLPLIMLFYALYDSDNKYLRFIAYVSLAIAAAIKIYPAVFGLLLIKRKRYKDAALLAVIGLTVFILPFFAFDGFSSLRQMLTGMTAANSENVGSGFGYNFSLTNILRILVAFLGKHIETAPKLLVYSGVFALFIGFVIARKEWQQLFFLSMICLWTPFFSYTYSLVLLFPPLLSFLREPSVKGKNKLTAVYMAFFVIVTVPHALPLAEKINYNLYSTHIVRLPLSYSTIIINLALIIISAIIFFESIYAIIKNSKRRTVK